MMTTIATTPAPLRLPFRKGQAVIYRDGQGAVLHSTIRRVSIVANRRYYTLEDARGVLIPGDRIHHTWEV